MGAPNQAFLFTEDFTETIQKLHLSSNKKGEFSLIKIEVASFYLFPYIAPKKDFDPLLEHGDNAPEKLLRNTTDLKDFKEPIVATLFSNFFAIYYYGQKVPCQDDSPRQETRTLDKDC